MLISNEVLVAQSDIKSIGQTVESLVIEFDQEAYETYISQSDNRRASRPYREISAKKHAHAQVPIAPVQATKPNVRDVTGKYDGVNHSCRYIYLLQQEQQAIRGSFLFIKRNKNTTHPL